MNGKRVEAVKNAEVLLNQILKENECYNLKDLKINGKDIINLGVKNGKDIGIILNDVLNRVIKEPAFNDKKKIIEYIKKSYKL